MIYIGPVSTEIITI